MTVHLDTHVAAFLHAGDSELLSPTAVHMLEAAERIVISPIAVLELHYLFELGKIGFQGDEIAGFIVDRFSVTVDVESMGEAVLRASSIGWTRDPFDRIITAHAALTGSFLLTRDRKIREHYASAIW